MMTIRRLAALGLLLCLGAVAGAQTGIPTPMPRAYFPNATGTACGGCLVFTYVAGTTTKQTTYADAALGTPNSNPVVLDANGTWPIFLNPTQSYKFVLAPSGDTDPPSAAIYTQDNITGPYSGVLNVTAADTRGLRVTRTSADAGLSLTSSGGSGKTYGLVSMTTGAFRLQDDSDATPRIELSGNNITATLTGTFTIDGGTLSATGTGHNLTASVVGGNTLVLRNASAGTSNYAGYVLGNDATGGLGGLYALSTTYTTAGLYTADGITLESTRAGGLSIGASHASGPVRFYTSGGSERGRITPGGRWGFNVAAPLTDVDVRSSADGVGGGVSITRSDSTYFTINVDDGLTTAWGSMQVGDPIAYRPLKLQPLGSVVLMPTQPAFLAYNSATDAAVLTGATVDFDTEVYDVAGNFSGDTFAAPVAGVYHFCAAVDWTDGGASAATLSFNISGTAYQFYRALVTDAGAASGCIDVQMTAGQTATVIVTTADVNIDIEGGSAPRITWFSGRLEQ